MRGGWRKLRIEELHNLYFAEDDQMKEGEVERICSQHKGSKKCVQNFCSRTRKEIYSEDVGINERLILKGILLKRSGKVWFGFIWLRIGTDDLLV
jgi:hypothetical protein